ncbi:MAG: ABATE domain-containing protein [Rubrivivax sp.]|nr:ABATE domain-containing protein [Pyrinomonadaceae bacterium]
MVERRANSKFFFVGNDRCIDFVNSELMRGGQAVDLFESFGDLVAWLREAEILSPAQERRALENWGGTREGERALQAARELRSDLKDMLKAIVAGKSVRQSTIEKINEHLRHQSGYAVLVKTRGGFEKRLHSDFDEPSQLLAPVAEAASDLLCFADPGLIKKCESESCVLYFYDTTKNHARRWCSMSMCGNRVKVAAHYQRARQERS